MRELDAARAKAKTIRGDARETLLDRLRELDGSLIDAVRAHCDTHALRSSRQKQTRSAAISQPDARGGVSAIASRLRRSTAARTGAPADISYE